MIDSVIISLMFFWVSSYFFMGRVYVSIKDFKLMLSLLYFLKKKKKKKEHAAHIIFFF